MNQLFFSFGAVALLLSAGAFVSAVRAGGAYNKTLKLQGITFEVQSRGEGSQQQLSIVTQGGNRPMQTNRQTINGRVVGAEVADLNSNSLPEVYVFVEGAGSGSYGELVAYSVANGSNLLPITLPELTGAMATGYQGHDQFRVVEGCLVRRFPIYKASDANAKATGGERQICYKLQAGEAGWILRPTSVLIF